MLFCLSRAQNLLFLQNTFIVTRTATAGHHQERIGGKEVSADILYDKLNVNLARSSLENHLYSRLEGLLVRNGEVAFCDFSLPYGNLLLALIMRLECAEAVRAQTPNVFGALRRSLTMHLSFVVVRPHG